MANWFPKTGRGLLIGIWACNINTGDIIGTQIYKYTSKDPENWYISFFIIGIMIFLFGLVSFLFLPENPGELGLHFEADGDDIVNPL